MNKQSKYLDKVIELSNNLNVDVEILKSGGAPEFLRKVKKRKVFAIGFLATFFIYLIISFFVLGYNIESNDNIDKVYIINSLKELGLQKGKIKYFIDFDDIESRFLNSNPDISYINIKMNGTTAIIDVAKNKSKVKVYDPNIPVNIIASEDGEIIRILCIKGTQAVKEGDKVKKGDILIMGKVDYQDREHPENADTYLVHAVGNVVAKTEYFFEKISIGKYSARKNQDETASIKNRLL